MNIGTTPLRLLPFVAATVASSVFAASFACAATPADTFVVARNTVDAITLDPHAAFEVSTGDIVRNLYRRLFVEDAKDPSKLTGDIADSWVLSEDGLTLTVKIKSGLVFASGNALSPEDVVFSLQRAVKLKKAPSFMLEGLGWTAENVDTLVSLGADDTVVLKTGSRLAPSYVRSVLSTSVASVVDKKEVLAHEAAGDLGNAWLTNHSAGSAAYVLVDWKPREAVVLEASPHYAGTPAKLKRIIVRHVADSSAQRLLLESGDADAASNLTADQIPAIEGSKELRVNYEPTGTVFYLGLNQANPDLAKPEVWEALRYLVDYDGIANNLLKGQLRINQGLIGEGLPAHLKDTPFTYDPQKAKALLAEAGYLDGVKISFDVPTLSPYNEIGQALVQSFAAGGVTLDLQSGDIKQILTKYRGREEDLIIFSFVPDFSDPQASLDFFLDNPDNSDAATKKSVAWRLHWQDKALSTSITEALAEADDAKRLQAYVDIQTQVRDHSPLVLSFQQIGITGLSAHVKDYNKTSVTEFVRFDEISKD